MSELAKVSEESTGQLTIEVLKEAMPPRQKTNITQGLVDSLNQIADEPEFAEYYRNNILGFTDALEDPNTTLPGYLAAVKYVSYKVMGMTNQEAWCKTFPERHQRLIDENKDPSYLRSLVCAYNKGKLVNKIYEQTMVPTWVLNQDLHQKALNVQAHLMATAKSEKVRSDAANSILTHLKPPEASKLEMDINVKQDDTVKDLQRTMTKLAEQQQRLIEGGVSAKDIAESDILDADYEEV